MPATSDTSSTGARRTARQLLFVGAGRAGPGLLLYTVDDGHVDELPVDLADGQNEIRLVGWTADGTRYAYKLETGEARDALATQVVDHRDRRDRSTSQSRTDISRTREPGSLALPGIRRRTLRRRQSRAASAVPIGTLGQAPEGTHRDGLYWSPDDRWIVTIPCLGSAGASCSTRRAPDVDQPAWLADGAESWQRVP